MMRGKTNLDKENESKIIPGMQVVRSRVVDPD
jgi:hypothetical protein